MSDYPIHSNLFTWPTSNPVLLGGCCPHCGEISFPAQSSCRNCSRNDSNVIELGNKGLLWTWTIQSFLPKPPYMRDETAETFKPYGVGYVEMPAGIRIESRLLIADPNKLQIGMPMKLVIEKFSPNDQGGHNLCFAFDSLENSQWT
ncbi:MAG: DNA-binding protein [Porticoccaceae bacterium]|nr:DNA-binding protein [Porticoccaceae bacterium]MAA55224.1 DNA-binding protein [Porticoccaceae bacterium]